MQTDKEKLCWWISKKELSYFLSFFSSNFPNDNVGRVMKTKHFKGYYVLLELFIPVTQGLKFVFSG